MVSPIAPTTSEPKPLKRLLPRGGISAQSWQLVAAHQEQPEFGWPAVQRGVLSHAVVTAVTFGAAAASFHSAWLLGATAIVGAIGAAVAYRGLENLVHGASHEDVCRTNIALNDAIGDVLFAAPVGQTINGFRQHHIQSHHVGFGGSDDRCGRRMRERLDVSSGSMPGLSETLRRVPSEVVAFARAVGTDRRGVIRALAWQGLVVFAPLALFCGLLPAVTAYLAVMPLALGVVLPVLRALAEAGEHDYADAGPDSVVERTFDNVGVLNALLHPYGDGYHVLHHFAPRIPQHRLGKLMRHLVKADPMFGFLARRRRGVLTAPEPYREGPLPIVPGRPAPVASANDNGAAPSQEVI